MMYRNSHSVARTKGHGSGGFIDGLFLVWVLSLPFYQISVVGSLSVDNILAPLLLVLWFAANSPSGLRDRVLRSKILNWTLLLLAVFSLGFLVSFLNDLDIFLTKGYLLLKRMLYFLLPLLFIKHGSLLVRTNSAIVLIAALAGISALAASLGIIDPVVARIESSRLGIEQLPKAVGLLSNFGDMAMLTAYALLLTLVLPKARYLFGIGGLLSRGMVLFALLLGLIGAQSRNIILTTATGVLAYIVLRYLLKLTPMVRVAIGSMVVMACLVMAMGCVVYLDELIQLLEHWGGESASGTARARLHQYAVALNVIGENPISGVGVETYRRLAPTLDSVHNMWLYLLVQGGVISAGAILALMARAFFGALTGVAGHANLSAEALVGASLIVSMVMASMFYPGATEFFWFLLGVVTSGSALRWSTNGHHVQTHSGNRLAANSILRRRLS